MLTINALAVSDSIIIPVTPEYLSAKGLVSLIKTILKLRNEIKASYHLLSYTKAIHLLEGK